MQKQIGRPFNDVAQQLINHPEQKLQQSNVEQILEIVHDKNVFIGVRRNFSF